MKSTNFHLRFFALLCIIVFVVLNLLPWQPVLAGPAVQTTDPKPYKSYMPILGKMEFPLWMGPYGGSAIHMVSDPRNANIVYAGSFGAGVYKSTDGGVNWTSTSAGLDNLTIYCLAIDPGNSNIIYAGTYGNGVYKSTNGGASWFQASGGMDFPRVIYSLAVNAGNGSLVYAGTRSKNTLDGTLYKSTNGGGSWEPVFSQSNDWIYSVAANPNDAEVVLAAAHEHGPYRSTNYGSNWSATNLTSDSFDEAAKGRVVAFDPRYASRAYYSAWHADFYRSNDSGSYFQPSNTGLIDTHVYPNGITFKPGSPDTIYMAAHTSSVAGVVKSGNAGASWGGAGLKGYTVYTVTAPGSDTVLAGTYLNGIYRSTDGGGNWAPAINGFTNAQTTGMVFPGNNVIIASTMGSGIQISTDAGATWRDYSGGLGDRFVTGLYLSLANPNIVFALTVNAGLYRIDRGASGTVWQATGMPALTAANSEQANQSITLTPASTPEGALPLMRRDAIDEYLELENETTAGARLQAQSLVTNALGSPITMAFAPSNANIAYLGTRSAGLYASGDGGLSWKLVSLAGTEVRSIAVDPTNPNHLFVATNHANRVSVSNDGGGNWTDIAVPASNIYSLAISPTNSCLYAGTNSGVWFFNGAQWVQAQGYGGEVKVIGIHPARSNVVVAGTALGAYALSAGSDVLMNFAQINGGVEQSINFDLKDPNHVYFGTVARSTVRIPLR